MTESLLRAGWSEPDSTQLRLLLDKHVGGPGQFRDRERYPNTLYLPLADSSCRVVLTYSGKEIVAIEPGEGFDAAEWNRISGEIEESLRVGPMKVGREYSFSSFRVRGSWRGEHSGVQILPPPDHAPRAPVEMAEHPFILEFPIQESDFWPVTNHRRLREHRRLTLLLNVLLAGRTSLLPRRSDHLWASVGRDDRDEKVGLLQRIPQFLRRHRRDGAKTDEIKWVQHFFFAKLGRAVLDELTPPAAEQLEEVEPEAYFATVGHDGKGLRVPADLDESIQCYVQLSSFHFTKFDRAVYWLDLASRQWNISMSASFAALVSAIESLTERGDVHGFECPVCAKPTQHEVPGATRRFKEFLDTHAPGASLAKRRDAMYSLRSGILHGSELMQLDQDRGFGLDPPWWNERELNDELWGLTRVALRNWLKNPPAE